MNVENCIEAQYRELMECSEPNAEYADLYKVMYASTSSRNSYNSASRFDSSFQKDE